MYFGVREICNVVFKANSPRKIGTSSFVEGQPVLYFDSLKTTSLEQATTTVYAQGGRGNTRLIAWDGEKTLTFTMEDALISEMGLAILAGAHLFDTTSSTLVLHVSEIVPTNSAGSCTISKTPSTAQGVDAYALQLNKNGEVVSSQKLSGLSGTTITGLTPDSQYLIDYYTNKTSGAFQIDLEPQVFAGNFYIEADTLFRDKDGADHAAQFIIPNGKIQSNFTLSMASTGDPSTFTFTVDAFPGYVNGDLTKKVMASIQVITDDNVALEEVDHPAGDVTNSKASDVSNITSVSLWGPDSITKGDSIRLIAVTAPAAGGKVQFSLDEDVTGVTINADSGVLTVDDTATADATAKIWAKAIIDGEPSNDIKDDHTVTIKAKTAG